MEGSFEKIATYTKAEVDKVFDRCKVNGSLYIAVNKANQEKVQEQLNQTVQKGGSTINLQIKS